MLGAPMTARAEESPSVQATVQPSSATLGDLLTLTLRVRYPNGYLADLPALSKTLGTFEVAAATAMPVQVEGADSIANFLVQLQNFTTGQQTLPAISIPLQDMRGRAQVLKTPELQVFIQDVPEDPKLQGDIRGIKGVIGPVAWSPWWWILALILAVGLGVFFWHRRQRVLHGPPPPPPVPLDEEALEALAALKASGWVEGGKLKEFYSGVSDTVRAYLEKGFRVPALERTTNELMRDLSRRNEFDADVRALLRELFESCDLVKFAKFRPDAGEALKDHTLAVLAVEKTRTLLRARDEKGAR
jgi:hypothetical protein